MALYHLGGSWGALHRDWGSQLWEIGVDRCSDLQPGSAAWLELCPVLHGEEGSSAVVQAAQLLLVQL